MESKNREQRRREKFGNKGGATKEAWPQSSPNPALARPADEDEAPVATTDAKAGPTSRGVLDATAEGDEAVADHDGIDATSSRRI
jgi:hypothetical protein